MSSNRCFGTYTKDITSSSDYITSKKQRSIYKTLQSDSINYGGNPTKKNGSKYNDNFYVSSTSNKNNPCVDGSNVLLACKSYELLLDITKGKKYNNPLMNNSAVKFSMWAGNVTQVSYTDDQIPVVELKWNTDADMIVNGSNNRILFPSPCIDDCNWNSSAYPGFVIDPSNQIFYDNCSSDDIEDNLNKPPSWLKNTGSLSFKHTNYYWKGANAQPLHGISYPGKINMWLEDVNPNNITPDVGTSNLTYEWCQGKSAIR